jgi:hypothetical protein
MATTAAHVPTIDYRRELGDLYAARERPALVDAPEIGFLMIDGHGDPDGSASFTEAVEALCAVAYALKFRMRSMPDGIDAAIMPLACGGSPTRASGTSTTSRTGTGPSWWPSPTS